MNSTAENSHHITFQVNDILFALDSESFHEIRFLRTLKEFPCMPDHMVGTINLRHERIPVVDMRKKLGLSKGSRTSESCIILAEKKSGEERYLMGLLSDSLPDVIGFDPGAVEPAQETETPVTREYLKGVGKIDGDQVMILDFEKLFSDEELLTLFSVDNDEPTYLKQRSIGNVA